jgi:NAD(P)-dependent dehydrogenase (short-subunit alcohol dehydrogenase family)
VDDNSRTLVHSGPLVRQKSDTRHSWSDVFGALFDNYFLLLKEETRPPMTVKRSFVWRPIPLEYLVLGSFNDTSEVRKERADNGSFINMSSTKHNVYPFSIYHAGAKAARRYFLYAPTATAREKWHKALVEAIGVWKARQDANKVRLHPLHLPSLS